MFAFPYVIHLFANELASLRRGRFAFRGIFPRSFDRLLIRHLEPPTKGSGKFGSGQQVWSR